MKQYQILEGNKLIAEFMELPKVKCSIGTETGIVTEGYGHPFVGVPVIPSGMQYRYSWDWLMPVVEKIESLRYTKCPSDVGFSTGVAVPIFTIEGESVIIDWHNGAEGRWGNWKTFTNNNKSKFENLYQAVVEFIKWYNENRD